MIVRAIRTPKLHFNKWSFFTPFLLCAILLILIFSFPLLAACKGAAEAARIPPYLPPQYYSCLETNASDLSFAYFAGYSGSLTKAETDYNGQYFVFKNITLKDWMVVDLDKGWLWLPSSLKCMVVDVSYVKSFKLDEMVDVVGLDAGVLSYQTGGLLFNDCYVLPAGSIQLPSSGGGGFNPGY